MSCSTSENNNSVNGAHVQSKDPSELTNENKKVVVEKLDLQGSRLLCMLADEELMLLGSCQKQMQSLRNDDVPVRVQHLPPPLLTLTVPVAECHPAAPLFPLLLPSVDPEPLRLEWEQVCGFVERASRPMTEGRRRREELRESEEGIERREWGILCNGVENTKEGLTHAFVIFVFVHPPSLPSSLSVSCSLSLFF